MFEKSRSLDHPSNPGEPSGGLGSNVYSLTDDLARLSLPAEFQDPQQRFAWLTSICYLVILIGVGGIKLPEDIAPPPPPPPTIVPIEVFVPQLTQQEPEPEPEQPPETPPETQETIADPTSSAPPEPTAVAALTPAVVFSLPTPGPVKIVSVERAEAGPPTKPIPPSTPTPTKPTGPTVFRRGSGNTTDGGFYPEPDYPPEAAKVHEQGTVTLLVIIDADGAAVSAKLHQSSGSTTLDRYTTQFVRKRWKWPRGEPRQYYVPVEYRLR